MGEGECTGSVGSGISSFYWRDSGFGGISERSGSPMSRHRYSGFVISNGIGIWVKLMQDSGFSQNPRISGSGSGICPEYNRMNKMQSSMRLA